MSLITLFILIIVTVGAFWLFKIAFDHVGKFPDAPPAAKWALQAIVIVVFIVAVCSLWGYGGGFITSSGDVRLP